MIVAQLSSTRLLAAVRGAARPDEDVVAGHAVREAVRLGFPRALVRDVRRPANPAASPEREIPTFVLDDGVLRAWETGRKGGGPDVPPERTAYIAFRIRMWLAVAGGRPSWVDLCLRDLGRIAGSPLPAAFRGMARRVLEFPSRYPDLTALGRIGGVSAGALKARFRRRGLASPYSYLRWLRTVAVGHILADPSATTLMAAHRVGISSSGNLCRCVRDTTGLTSTEIRAPGGRERLLVAMSESLLRPSDLVAWTHLESTFVEVA